MASNDLERALVDDIERAVDMEYRSVLIVLVTRTQLTNI